jgi:hypothetical protein
MKVTTFGMEVSIAIQQECCIEKSPITNKRHCDAETVHNKEVLV